MSRKFDDRQWVIQIFHNLEEEIEQDNEITPVNIFTVPKILKDIDPSSYIPQEVSIGPYHYHRPELHEMDRYKLAAARRKLKQQAHGFSLQDHVDHLQKFEPSIRANYKKFLSFSSETMSCMMAVDGIFLLEFLQLCAFKQGNYYKPGQYNAILRDISMLENQIPLVVLRKQLEFEFSSMEKANEMLRLMLHGLCTELSPFKLHKDFLPPKININVMERVHLLDVLYHFIVPELEGQSEVLPMNIDKQEIRDDGNIDHTDEKELFSNVWVKIYEFLIVPCDFIRNIMLSDAVQKVLNLRCSILSSIPIFKIVKIPLEKYLNFLSANGDKDKDDEEEAGFIAKSPLLEEIEIPSVTQLAKAGIRFKAMSKGIESILFDNKTMTLYLPTMNIDANTEVVLRNMVAYEACSSSGALVLARYIELMNGIIDTSEDAKFLRKRGIVVNRLKSDQEVADLWNGMTKSIRLTKVPCLDKVIEDVNKYYNSTWRVKLGKCVKRYVFESWKLLTIIAAVFMVVLMALQAFCSAYSCARFAHLDKFV